MTGDSPDADLPKRPRGARVERFVPFAALKPHVAALVTNGGYGGLHFALAHGVPVVVAGASEEKPELVTRVNWSGIGIGMRTQRPRPEMVRAAVRRVLTEPGHKARAAAIQAEMAGYRGAAHAAALVEELAGARTAALV